MSLQLDHQAEVKVLNDRLDKERENMKTFKENVKKQFDQRHEQVGSSDCCTGGATRKICGAVRTCDLICSDILYYNETYRTRQFTEVRVRT